MRFAILFGLLVIAAALGLEWTYAALVACAITLAGLLLMDIVDFLSPIARGK